MFLLFFLQSKWFNVFKLEVKLNETKIWCLSIVMHYLQRLTSPIYPIHFWLDPDFTYNLIDHQRIWTHWCWRLSLFFLSWKLRPANVLWVVGPVAYDSHCIGASRQCAIREVPQNWIISYFKRCTRILIWAPIC